MKIFPSLISANLLNLQQVIKTLDSVADGYHLDIMDNHFVPNLTWGAPFVNAITQITTRPLDVHLMVHNPASLIDKLTLRPTDTLTFHLEGTPHARELVQTVQHKGWLCGIALSPKTPASAIFDLCGIVSHITVMTVEPGFSGQAFLPDMLEKIDILDKYRHEKQLNFVLVADGGINTDNIRALATRGVDEVAAAAAIFSHHNPVTAIMDLKKAAEKK